MRKLLLLSLSVILITIPALAKKQTESTLSVEQGKRGTTKDSYSWNKISDDGNSLRYRIIRRGGAPGEYHSMVSDSTMFVVSTYYPENKEIITEHICIFLVKGNLTLKEIDRGLYKGEDVLQMSCETKRVKEIL